MSKKLIFLTFFVLVLGLVGSNVALGEIFETVIADETNDTEEDLNPDKLGEADRGSSDLEFPYEDEEPVEPFHSDPQLVGLRFQVDIPAGKLITNAWIRFKCDKADKLPAAALAVNVIIEGELSPDAPAFLDDGPGLFDLSSRPTTIAKVQWSVPVWVEGDQGPDQTSTNIASIIQEIIDLPGWASGNSLVLIIRDDPDNPSEGLREAEDANPPDGDESALLHIEFGEAGATIPTALYVWNGSAGDGIWDTPANWTVTDSIWTWPNEERGDKHINADTLAIDILNGDAVSRVGGLGIEGADALTTPVLTLNNGSSLTTDNHLGTGTDPDTKGQIDILGGSTVTILGDGRDVIIADDPGSWGMLNIVDSILDIADDLKINHGEGYINISGSASLSCYAIEIANETTGVGTVDISGTATVTLGDDIDVGKKGVGTLNISGDATLVIPDELYIGDDAGSEGHMTMSGNATVTIVDDLDVGDDGFGTLDISGNASISVDDDINVGSEVDSEGHMTMSGNSTVSTADELYIGKELGATGILDVSGTATLNVVDDIDVGNINLGTLNIGEDATVNVDDDIIVATEAGSEGQMTISGNALVTCQDLVVVSSGGATGYLHISGYPTIHTTEEFYMNDSEGEPSISQVIMDGGIVTIDSYCTFNDDNPGTAEFIMNGGSFYCADYLNLSDNLDGTAHLTMNGGEMISGDQLILGKDGGEDTGQVRIFMNGGLLQAEGLDIQITDTMIVFNGGDFQIRQPFQPDPVGDPNNWWGLSEAGMQQLITDGTIVVEVADWIIITDGDYTVLSAPPVGPPELVRTIAAGSDDAEEHVDYPPEHPASYLKGEMELDSSDLELVYEDEGQGDMQVVGLRFTDITIPKGTKIKDAWVQFDVDETKGGRLPIFLQIYGELSPHAATFTKDDHDITSRPKTKERVFWQVHDWTDTHDHGPDQATLDISDIIEEIVKQDGWVSGNALVLIFSPDWIISTGVRCAESFEGADGKLERIPTLTVIPK